MTTACVCNNRQTVTKNLLLDNTGQVGPVMDSNVQEYKNQIMSLVSCSLLYTIFKETWYSYQLKPEQ